MVSEKNKKNDSKDVSVNSGETLGFFAKMLQESAITIFWEGVDRFKKEVKVRVSLGIKAMVGVSIIILGLIFALIGIARFLEVTMGTSGFGYIFTGIGIVLAGIYLKEKADV